MAFCLDAKIIKPVGENINNIVILLHGYGGDGNDIAALSINWMSFLPNTIFISSMNFFYIISLSKAFSVIYFSSSVFKSNH